MDRRILSGERDWAALRAAFRWQVPARFNIAQACCTSWAQADPDRIALRDRPEDGPPRDWTYGDLDRASDGLALAFRAAGIGPGDRVAVLLPQGAAVPIAHFAAQKLGAVVLPLFTLFGDDALRYRLTDSGAAAVVTDGANLDRLMALRADLPASVAVWCTDPAPAPVRDFWADAAAPARGFQLLDTAADDPAVMIYTSGTTGPAKGVLHAHRFLIGHLPCMETSHAGFGAPGDCGWTPADWAWIGGLMDMAMPCLYYGVPLVAQRMRKFDPEAAVRLIRTEGIRNLFLPPTALKRMRQAGVGGLSVRSIASGGESLGAEMLAWGRAALGAPVSEIYGQTECNLVITQSEAFMDVRPGSMGRAVPGMEVAVIDGNGQPAAPGSLGEIAVRRGTPVMFLRYWNRPEQTAAKFTGDWMRTGDLGTCDAEGRFTYVARDDDIITCAGYRIGPSEIEDCLMGHADVAMAAVVGVPDPVTTEAVVAHVVLRDGASWDGIEEALRARVRAKVGAHLVPRRILRADTLPMTATGKIIRRDLRGA